MVSILILHTCTITDSCTHGEVHSPLLGRQSETEGLVEVCVNGTFLPVSLNNGEFTVTEASVICRDLGVGNGQLTHYYVTWIFQMGCNGSCMCRSIIYFALVVSHLEMFYFIKLSSLFAAS